MTSKNGTTCASCQHIQRMYHTDGIRFDHSCAKQAERRKEGMSPNADFLDHFRAFFDASADQKACRHYAERPVADEATLRLLAGMADNKGRGEFKFFSPENTLAEQLDKQFVRHDMHAPRSAPGNRVYWLLPLGKAELARASAAG